MRQLLDLCERERKLVAYELHDGCVQELVAAAMHLEVGLDRWDDSPAARAAVEEGLRLVRAGLAEVRRVMQGIRPPSLERGGLRAAIEQLASEWQAAGLAVQLDLHLIHERLVPTLESAVYRILQEAVHNAQRHSGTTLVQVAVRETEGALELRVEDAGCGFTVAEVPASCYGLRGIRERAQLFGGQAAIDSQPGKGTRVFVSLPLRDYLLG